MIVNKEGQPSLRFGAALRHHRQGAGLTVTELACRIGRTQSYVSQLESGALHPPDDDMLAKIAGVLGIDAEKLIVEAGRLPKSVFDLALDLARRDLAGFKETLTASAATSFHLNYDAQNDGSSSMRTYSSKDAASDDK